MMSLEKKNYEIKKNYTGVKIHSSTSYSPKIYLKLLIFPYIDKNSTLYLGSPDKSNSH